MFTKIERKYIFVFAIFVILLLVAYLPFIKQTGFSQDDWNTLFITEQRGAGSLVDHFSIDRPLRGYFSLAEYRLLKTNLNSYQFAALTWRFLDGVIIFGCLMLIWPKNFWRNTLVCSLILIFPGFHEQTHAFDYQAQLFSRMCMVASIYLSLLAVKTKKTIIALCEVLIAIGLAQVSYGLMEYYIGIEVLRFFFLFVLLFQEQTTKKKTITFSIVFLSNAVIFFIWRMFFFEVRRASVDSQVMFSGYTNLWQKIIEDSQALLVNLYRLLFSAYYEPLSIFSKSIPFNILLFGIFLVVIATTLVIFLFTRLSKLSVMVKDEKKEP